jgi:hypothetical protein
VTSVTNRAWNLQAFLDSLIVELDRARDTLAVKGVTRPLSYSVQDLGLDVQVFPQFDGRKVRFVTAEPGQAGASGLKIQLGSITSRGIKETTSEPPQRDDISLDDLEELDDDARESLQRVGVTSVRDIERMEERNVDITSVAGGTLDYGSLAGVINKARRRRVAPAVKAVGISQSADGPLLRVEGRHLDIAPSLRDFPVARLDGEQLAVVESSPDAVVLRVDPGRLRGAGHALQIALDPFAVVAMELEA